MKNKTLKNSLLSLMLTLNLAHVGSHNLYAGTESAVSITSYATPKAALLLSLLTAGVKEATSLVIRRGPDKTELSPGQIIAIGMLATVGLIFVVISNRNIVRSWFPR